MAPGLSMPARYEKDRPGRIRTGLGDGSALAQVWQARLFLPGAVMRTWVPLALTE